MADKSVIDMLASWIGPKEAEAKIRGTPEAMELLSDLWAQAEKNRTINAQTFQGKELPPVTTYLPDMYARIYRAADARPEITHITPQEGLLKRGIHGDFNPRSLQIRYDPSAPIEDIENTLPHELLHFLNKTSERPQHVDVQHALFDAIFGGSLLRKFSKSMRGQEYTPIDWTSLEPGKTRALTPQEQEIIRSWFIPAKEK